MRTTSLKFSVFLPVLIAAGCGGGSSGSSDWTSSISKASQDISAPITSGSVPGAIVEVTQNGKIWTQGFGLANVQLNQTMNPTMEFRIGSVTKTFVAMLAMYLNKTGKIKSLDDPIINYIPTYVPTAWNAVTIRMLATMSSGIPDFADVASYKSFLTDNPNHVFTPQELLNYVNTKSPTFTPGSSETYSNTNGLLLGLICEAVGGPVPSQLNQDFFLPMNLTGSEEPTNNLMPSNSAHGYSTINLAGDGTFDSPSHFTYAADMISNASDLSTWVRALGKGTISGEDYSQLLVNPAVPKGTPTYGFGVEASNHGWVGHLGQIAGGYQTAAYYNPNLDATIVVMVNSDRDPSATQTYAGAIFESVVLDFFGSAYDPGMTPVVAS